MYATLSLKILYYYQIKNANSFLTLYADRVHENTKFIKGVRENGNRNISRDVTDVHS